MASPSPIIAKRLTLLMHAVLPMLITPCSLRVPVDLLALALARKVDES